MLPPKNMQEIYGTLNHEQKVMVEYLIDTALNKKAVVKKKFDWEMFGAIIFFITFVLVVVVFTFFMPL